MAITSNPTIQNGAMLTAQGQKTFLNVSANTLVKATAGRVAKINVVVAGGTNTGGVYDSASIAGAGATNLVAIIPDTVGSYLIDFPCANGIVVEPGSGNTVAISYL
jgi:Mg2+/citrate symporter